MTSTWGRIVGLMFPPFPSHRWGGRASGKVPSSHFDRLFVSFLPFPTHRRGGREKKRRLPSKERRPSSKIAVCLLKSAARHQRSAARHQKNAAQYWKSPVHLFHYSILGGSVDLDRTPSTTFIRHSNSQFEATFESKFEAKFEANFKAASTHHHLDLDRDHNSAYHYSF